MRVVLSATAAALLSVQLLLAGEAAQAGESTPAQPPPPSPPLAIPLTTSLQGNEGVHVQTMCTNCNTANIDLSGLGGNLLPIDVDGYDVIGGLMTIYALGVTPPALMGNITVEKGPGGHAAPPEAIGGSIHISSAAFEARPLFQGEGETGSFGWASGQANATWRRGGFTGTALYLRGHSDAIDANGDGFNESGRLSRRFGSAEASYRFAGGLRLTGAASAIREDAPDGHGPYSFIVSSFDGETTYLREDAFVDFAGQRLGMDLPVGEGGTITLRAVHFVRDQDTADEVFVPSGTTLDPTYQIQDRNFSSELRWDHLITDRVLVSGGIAQRRQVLEVENFKSVLPALSRGTDVFHNSGADVGVDIDVSSKWHLSGGVRYDRLGTSHTQGAVDPMSPFADTNDKDVRRKTWYRSSPRARLTWKPASAWAVTFSAGSGARAARPIFEEVCCGQQYQSSIEPKLERSRAGSIEALWQPAPVFRIGAYAHRTVLDDHIMRMVGASQAGVQTYAQLNVPRARYTGLTLTSRAQLPERLIFDVSWSWLHAVNPTGRPAFGSFYPPGQNVLSPIVLPVERIPYRAIRGGSASIQWTEPRARYDFGLQAQYQGPMLIQHWNANIANQPKCDLVPVFGSQLCEDYEITPSFWVVNARATYRPKPWIGIHVGVDNIGRYVQTDLRDPKNDFNWGPIRGRYIYGGVTVTPRGARRA